MVTSTGHKDLQASRVCQLVLRNYHWSTGIASRFAAHPFITLFGYNEYRL